MEPKTKKLIFILLGLVAITGLLFISQIKKALNISINSSPEPFIADQGVDIPIERTDEMLGNPGAALTLVEFVDLGDSSSKNLHQQLVEFVTEHPTLVRLVWKNFPTQHLFSGDSTPFHVAAFCAGMQKSFWPYIDVLTKQTINNNTDSLAKVATNLSLSGANFTNCLGGTAATQKIQTDQVLGKQIGVNSMPALFVNNKKLLVNKDVDLKKMLATLIAP